MNCFVSITGADTNVMIHGNVLSILLARASSRAAALHGLAKMAVGTGLVTSHGRVDGRSAPGRGARRDGDSVGEEKERR